MHGRVHTLSRLKQFGMVHNNNYHLCINKAETTTKHWFLKCLYKQHMFKIITFGKCIPLPAVWERLQMEVVDFQEHNIFIIIRIFIYRVRAYSIWKERNNRYHKEESLSLANLVSIKNLASVCNKLISILLSPKWFNNKEHHILSTWSINV